MICSFQKIEFIADDGSETVLLDYGDFLEEEIEFGSEQQTSTFSPIGADWGISIPDGGTRRSFSFSRRKEHGSLTESQSWCYVHPSLMPFNKEGVIKVSIREAVDAPVEVWQMDSAVLQGCSARRFFTPRQSFFSLTTYQVTAGRMYPIEGYFGQCYPINWQTYIIDEDESIIGDDVCDSFDPYVPPAPTPETPGELEPEFGTIPGFTVSGVVSPSVLNGHYSPNGYESGNQRWKGPADSVVVMIGTGTSWDLRESISDEPSFYTTDAPEFPWQGTWVTGIGTGTVVVTVDT